MLGGAVGPVMPRGSMIRAPHVQMMAPPKGEGFAHSSGDWKPNISNTRISEQTFPPTVLNGVDTKYLVHSWADSFMDSPGTVVADASTLIPSSLKMNDDGLPSMFEAPRKEFRSDDNALVLQNMGDVIAEATGIFTQLDYPTINEKLYGFLHPRNIETMLQNRALVMMGLIPKDFSMSFLESGSSAVQASVLGLCLFSEQQIQDDSRGSLRTKISEQYWKGGTPLGLVNADNQIEVYAIEGIADAPGLPELSSRVLLSKIEKLAHKDQKAVVVPKWARTTADRKDLTEHYVHLGFEKVEMEDGSHELVYTGTSLTPEDEWVENQQIMVGMTLLARP